MNTLKTINFSLIKSTFICTFIINNVKVFGKRLEYKANLVQVLSNSINGIYHYLENKI